MRHHWQGSYWAQCDVSIASPPAVHPAYDVPLTGAGCIPSLLMNAAAQSRATQRPCGGSDHRRQDPASGLPAPSPVKSLSAHWATDGGVIPHANGADSVHPSALATLRWWSATGLVGRQSSFAEIFSATTRARQPGPGPSSS
jgi:hypothetical protein